MTEPTIHVTQGYGASGYDEPVYYARHAVETCRSVSGDEDLCNICMQRELLLARYDRQVKDAERTLNKLDTEDDDTQRALLIDHVISLADINAAVAHMWKEYR